jgi:hypothetical protein
VSYIVEGIDMAELYPAPFPNDVLTVALKTISLRKLLEEDKEEMEKLFENCKEPGFFNLNLKDHPFGLELLREAVDCVAVVRALLPVLPMLEKRKFKTRGSVGIFDKGYVTKEVLPEGTPRFSETFNVSIPRDITVTCKQH